MATTASSAVPSGQPISPSSISDTIKEQEALPKLSMEDFRIYNKQANMMEYYHNRFRQTWTTLYTACSNNARPKSMSLSTFMNLGLQFVSHLTVHHDIEETYIFPILAKRMPEFSHHVSETDSNPTARLMVLQHQQIHAGLDRLEKYLGDCKAGRQDFRLQGEGSLMEVMDSFGEVLWIHLDAEVKLLGAENMRRFWSKEEIHRMNF